MEIVFYVCSWAPDEISRKHSESNILADVTSRPKGLSYETKL
jgi:hypothetical protein